MSNRLHYKNGKPRAARELLNDLLYCLGVTVLERGDWDYFMDKRIRYDELGEIIAVKQLKTSLEKRNHANKKYFLKRKTVRGTIPPIQRSLNGGRRK